MDCIKTTQFSKGAYVFQKCSCTKCQIKKSANEAFWNRFDALYQDYIGQASHLEPIGEKND